MGLQAIRRRPYYGRKKSKQSNKSEKSSEHDEDDLVVEKESENWSALRDIGNVEGFTQGSCSCYGW